MSKKKKSLSKNVLELDAEICRIIAANRSNCDFLLHKLILLGFREDDVEPLRKEIQTAKLGKGYVHFMLSAEDLISCEPKLDTSKVAPIMLETWNGIYDMEHLHVNRAKILKTIEFEKDEKSAAYADAVKNEEEALAVFAKVNVEFSRYRALNHVFLGTYKPKPPEHSFDEEGLEVMEACKKSDLERVKQLLAHPKYHANEYEKHTGATPLHVACWNKDEAIVENLLRAKAKVNAQTLRGFTPLHFAYQQHSEPIVKHLLAGKADPSAKSAMGQAPGGKGTGLGSELEILKPYY